MTTTNGTVTTKTIAGREVALTEGRQYRAQRPMASHRGQVFRVTIVDVTDYRNETDARTIPGLSYDEANDFINDFNDGPTSWDARTW